MQSNTQALISRPLGLQHGHGCCETADMQDTRTSVAAVCLRVPSDLLVGAVAALGPFCRRKAMPGRAAIYIDISGRRAELALYFISSGSHSGGQVEDRGKRRKTMDTERTPLLGPTAAGLSSKVLSEVGLGPPAVELLGLDFGEK